jgi:hypothetical protein
MRSLQTLFLKITETIISPGGYLLMIEASKSGLGRLERPVGLLKPKNGAL